jgi:glycosyltransferase involved in cell wall biosynthesis
VRRPAVSIVVPFRGDGAYAARTRRALERLELRAGDEVIVADNTADGAAAQELAATARVISANRERSSYHARNAGAAQATNDWLSFMDADCVPVPDLIDRLFAEPIPARCGAVAGGIIGVGEQEGLLARYARDRNFLDQSEGMHGSAGVAAATGNLLIRGATFDQLGGFVEGIRSAGDVEFCWRMHRAGWSLEHRPAALVEHHHRENLASFLGMIARYGAGSRWLNERHPGAAPRWPLAGGLLGAARDVGSHLLGGRLEPAAFRAIDGLGLVAHNVGYRSANDVRSG